MAPRQARGGCGKASGGPPCQFRRHCTQSPPCTPTTTHAHVHARVRVRPACKYGVCGGRKDLRAHDGKNRAIKQRCAYFTHFFLVRCRYRRLLTWPGRLAEAHIWAWTGRVSGPLWRQQGHQAGRLQRQRTPTCLVYTRRVAPGARRHPTRSGVFQMERSSLFETSTTNTRYDVPTAWPACTVHVGTCGCGVSVVPCFALALALA